MKWASFSTPVKTLMPDRARAFLRERAEGTFTLLDVRQPGEYEKARIPGARLIPLPELPDRLNELEIDKPLLAYCAVGGRSRSAAQYLSGQGFPEVYSLKGGIKAWEGLIAAGPEEEAVELIRGNESAAEILILAYGMEVGLADFYRRVASEKKDSSISLLFENLAGIEDRHRESIFRRYRVLTGATEDREEFESSVVSEAMEGGYTTDEFLAGHRDAMDTEIGVLSTAMMLEAQALDLYARYSHRSRDPKTRDELLKIADEEKQHLASLGRLLDKIAQD